MKNLNNVFTIIICAFFTTLNAQEKTMSVQKTVAIFEIFDARDNGLDITPIAIENEAYLAIYKSSKNVDEILLSNFWEMSSSQSFGSIYNIVKEEFPESDEYYKAQFYNFYWSYKNSYDDKRGTAKVTLKVVYKSQGIYFKFTIIPEDLDELVYQGEMIGDLTLLESYLKK